VGDYDVMWFVLGMAILFAVLALTYRYLAKQGSYKVAPIGVHEMEELDRLRAEAPDLGTGKPRGRVLFRNEFMQDRLVITEEGIQADFGTPQLHDYGRFRMVQGEHVVVYLEKRFYPFDGISGIYPIEVAVSLYDDPVVMPGFQVETTDYRTAVVLFRYSGERFVSKVLKALGPSAGTLVRGGELMRGSDAVVGGVDGEGTTIFRGDIYRHKYLRDHYRLMDLNEMLGNR
jgi:hypothetical protein